MRAPNHRARERRIRLLQTSWFACALVLSLQPLTSSIVAAAEPSGYWSAFRGTDRQGHGDTKAEAIPSEWSDTKNILWKTPLPGRGASSPILWQDNIYLTAYTGYGLANDDTDASLLTRKLICINRLDGRMRWVVDIPSDGRAEHSLSSFLLFHGYASSTPVADESGVYFYLGHAGIFAYDHSGKRRWHAPSGDRQHNWGSASSPILFQKLLIVHADPETHSLMAFDKETGRKVWSVHTGAGDSWSTPLIVDAGQRKELVYHHADAHNSPDRTASVAAVDPLTGTPLWKCTLLKDYLCPSPVAQNGVIYWLGYQKSAAVRSGGSGDVTVSHIIWNAPRGTEICTPVVQDGHLYWTNEENGIAYCVNAKSGELIYQERLEPKPGRLYASGVLANGRIYYVSRESGTYVIEARPRFSQIAHNRIASDGGIFNATPAVDRGRLYLRSDRFLYCIGTK